jgi:hypothetical protein
MISLNQISSNIISKKNIRELFSTSNGFFSFKINYSEELFASNITMDNITINLTYRDLLSFLRVYTINMKKFKNALKKSEEYLKNLELNKNIQKDKNKNNINKGNENLAIKNNVNKIKSQGTPNDFMTKTGKIVYTATLNFEKMDITLIDNSKGSYHPFMNMICNKIYLILNPNKSIESSFDFALFSYNYIACIWEPTIEKTTIKFTNIYIKEHTGINNKVKIELNNISINLSDMAISFTLLTFNNWLKKLQQKQKKFEEDEELISKNIITTKQEEPKNISKITNNQIINYTGVDLKIIHNGKEIDCPILKEVDLEYINEYNKSKKIINYVRLIYDKEHKYEIPLEKLITLRHIINNELSIISSNVISENRSINIYLYSPIIFKNKSIYSLQITVENKDIGNAFLVLNPNSITGLPMNLINKKTTFNFMLINTKKDKNNENKDKDYSGIYDLETILSTNINIAFQKQIKFKNKSLIMKLDHKIPNVRTLIINKEYSIINCLP